MSKWILSLMVVVGLGAVAYSQNDQEPNHLLVDPPLPVIGESEVKVIVDRNGESQVMLVSPTAEEQLQHQRQHSDGDIDSFVVQPREAVTLKQLEQRLEKAKSAQRALNLQAKQLEAQVKRLRLIEKHLADQQNPTTLINSNDATTTYEQSEPVQQQQTMPTLQLTKQVRWQYKVAGSSGGVLDRFEMSEIGDDGWELVAVTEANNQYKFFFKRPKQ